MQILTYYRAFLEGSRGWIDTFVSGKNNSAPVRENKAAPPEPKIAPPVPLEEQINSIPYEDVEFKVWVYHKKTTEHNMCVLAAWRLCSD